MLAQLEAVEGIREARVDWTGQSFLLSMDASARPEKVVAELKKLLGPTAQRLQPDEEQEQIATFKAGAPWLRSGETARMSAHEAKVLAQRYATDAARDAGLDEERSGRLIALVQDELEKLFGRFEQTGLPSRDGMTAEWKELAGRVAERSRAFLTNAEVDRVAAYLRDRCSK